jgi:deazaflavin-dependent oxidoreductase (nitroreductase family)
LRAGNPGESEELVLITRGRRTGAEHRVTVWFARDDDTLWLRTDGETDWHRNLRSDPRARVIIDGRELAARYEPSADRDADLKRLVELWRAKYGPMWVQDWYFERGREPVKLRLSPA